MGCVLYFLMNSLLFLFFAKKFFCNQRKWGLLYRYYKFSVDIVFGRCSSELAELFLLPYLCGRSTRYSNRLHNFSVTILGSFYDVSVNSFFPYTARLWNFLPAECFPLTYYRNGFKRDNAQVFIFC